MDGVNCFRLGSQENRESSVANSIILGMSREHPYTTAVADGTLFKTGKIYHVKLALSLRELWGEDTSPDDFEIDGEELLLMTGTAIEDGAYRLRYSFTTKISTSIGRWPGDE